jgi:hypothetical protein
MAGSSPDPISQGGTGQSIRDMELSVSPNCLVVFVDDTGHELLLADQGVYGLGGCAALAGNIEPFIREPWRNVRQLVTGSKQRQLHAADFGQTASKQDIRAVSEFFRSQPFSRFGAVVTLGTSLSSRLSPVQTVARVLGARIAHIAKWTAFSEIKVVIESSQRADSLLVEAFQGMGLQEDSKPVPLDFYFMPKAAAEPALEVADFIMHAVGRQARRQLGGKSGFNLDFAAVFQGVDERLVSFLNVLSVVANPST